MAWVLVCVFNLRRPVADNLLALFHYVLGLYRLGHEVAYLEESGWPYSCYDPVSREWQNHPETGLRVVESLLADYDVRIPVHYVNRDYGQVTGSDGAEVKRCVAAVGLLFNVGGTSCR